MKGGKGMLGPGAAEAMQPTRLPTSPLEFLIVDFFAAVFIILLVKVAQVVLAGGQTQQTQRGLHGRSGGSSSRSPRVRCCTVLTCARRIMLPMYHRDRCCKGRLSSDCRSCAGHGGYLHFCGI